MAHGMIYDMYIWHTKSLKTTGIYASCNIPTSLSRSLFVGWINIWGVMILSQIRELLTKPVLSYFSLHRLCIYIIVVFGLHKFGHKKTRDVKEFPANVGISRLYVSCFSILP